MSEVTWVDYVENSDGMYVLEDEARGEIEARDERIEQLEAQVAAHIKNAKECNVLIDDALRQLGEWR